MPTQINITLWKDEKMSHEDIMELLTKVYNFGTSEGMDVRNQSTSVS